MATFVFQKQLMLSGESRISDELVVPAGLTAARVQLDMNTAEMRDPTTDVRGLLEFFDPIEAGDWRLIASTRLTGDPSNSVADQPSINIGQSTLQQLEGKRIRGRIIALSNGSYGATLSWS